MDQQETETTALLSNGNGTADETSSTLFHSTNDNNTDNNTDNDNNNKEHDDDCVTAQELYFPAVNPSVQGYYRFTATKLTPFAVLHTHPEDGPLHKPNPSSSSATNAANANLTKQDAGNNVTGLLRRSAVLPSHGMDPSGRWVLVSVGGRSGWARRELLTPMRSAGGGHGSTTSSSNGVSRRGDLPMRGATANGGSGGAGGGGGNNLNAIPKGSFNPAPTFRASEGWMGNHIFLFQGKVMLGSDAPLFFVTNFLIVGFFLLHFYVLLPHLYHVELLAELLLLDDDETNSTTVLNNSTTSPTYLRWTTHSITVWTTTILAILSMIFLWMSAAMDPGILPPISSPVRTPVPEGENIIIGGPLGYKYCSTCNIFRPPRSKHCNSCNVCVSKFDQ